MLQLLDLPLAGKVSSIYASSAQFISKIVLAILRRLPLEVLVFPVIMELDQQCRRRFDQAGNQRTRSAGEVGPRKVGPLTPTEGRILILSIEIDRQQIE